MTSALRNVIYFNKVWTVGSSANRPKATQKNPRNPWRKSRSSIRWMLIQIGDWPFQSFDKGCHCLEWPPLGKLSLKGEKQEVMRFFFINLSTSLKTYYNMECDVETVKLSGMLASCMDFLIISDGKLENSYSKLTDISCCWFIGYLDAWHLSGGEPSVFVRQPGQERILSYWKIFTWKGGNFSVKIWDRNRGGLVLFDEFCRWVASVFGSVWEMSWSRRWLYLAAEL